MSHDVFISYASPDKPTADAVCHALEANGIRCWIAPRDIPGGMNYAETLIKAINGARVMVLVFSSKTDELRHVRNEIERAFSKDTPVIPFRIENTPALGALEYFLSMPHWLDAFTPPMDKHLRNLSDTVGALLLTLSPSPQAEAPLELTTPVVAIPPKPKAPARTEPKVAPPPSADFGAAQPTPVSADPPPAAPLPRVEISVTPPAAPEPEEAPVVPPPVMDAAPSPWRRFAIPRVSRKTSIAVGGVVALAAILCYFGWHFDVTRGTTRSVLPSVPTVSAPSPTDQMSSAPWPEPDTPWPAYSPDKNAARKTLDVAAVYFAKLTPGQPQLPTAAEVALNLAQGYADIGDRARATEFVEKSVRLTSTATNGDIDRTSRRIFNFANAAILLQDMGRNDLATGAANAGLGAWNVLRSLPVEPSESYRPYPSSRLVAALVHEGKTGEARKILDWLVETYEKQSPPGTDPIMAAVFSVYWRLPIGWTANYDPDTALEFAQSLPKDLRQSGYLNVLEQLPDAKRCNNLAQKVAALWRQMAGNDDDYPTFATDAASCKLKDDADWAIAKVMVANSDQTNYIALANAAVTAGTLPVRRDLLDRARTQIVDAASTNTGELPSNYCAAGQGGVTADGPVPGMLGMVRFHAKLHQYNAAVSDADKALAKAKSYSDVKNKLQCITLVSETLIETRIWGKAGEVALDAFRVMQAQGRPSDLNVSTDGSQRIATVLAKTGHISEARQALAFASAQDTDVKVGLTADAARWGDLEDARAIAKEINTNYLDYYRASAALARAQAGVPDRK